jgi:hypothetical protein
MNHKTSLFFFLSGDATILEESEKIKTEPGASRNTARQLRSRTSNDDDQPEGNSDEMYLRAREKHARAVEREHRQDIKDEPVNDEIPKSSAPVKVRRINDESTQNFDDEQIEMGVGLGGKKKKNENKKEENTNTKENDELVIMPIATEKKRQAEETRIERIRRLCEKRTVGDVLDAATQAYHERQQKRAIFKDYIEKAET